MDWQLLGGLTIAAVGVTAVGLVLGAGLAHIYGWIGEDDDADQTDPVVVAPARDAAVSGAPGSGVGSEPSRYSRLAHIRRFRLVIDNDEGMTRH